jgi:hypothetical protein
VQSDAGGMVVATQVVDSVQVPVIVVTVSGRTDEPGGVVTVSGGTDEGL